MLLSGTTPQRRAMKVAGVDGRSVMFHSPSPIQAANGRIQLERDWLVVVPQHDGSVIFMIFVAPTYEAMLKSLQLQ